MTTLQKFPDRGFMCRMAARLPRRSKNGTPEEREAAKQKATGEVVPMSRRAVAGIAAAPALAAPAAAIGYAASPIVDPIFAGIEAHRMAHAERARCVKVADVIPREEAPPGAEAALDAASDAEYGAMIDLLNIRPATTAGLAALLQYAVDHGEENWMDVYIEDGSYESFMECLVQHAAETLAVQS